MRYAFLALAFCPAALWSCGYAVESASAPEGDTSPLFEEYEGPTQSVSTMTIRLRDERFESVFVNGGVFSSTLKPSKNLAICVTSKEGATTCYPTDDLARSRCPSTEWCDYKVDGLDGSFAITVFTVTNLGRDMVDVGIDRLAEFLDESGDAAPALKDISDANQRRAVWLSSFLVVDWELAEEEAARIERRAREDVVARVFPGSAHVAKGALSAPFMRCYRDETDIWPCEPSRNISLSVEAVWE